MGLISRFQRAWDVFRNREPTVEYKEIGPGYSVRQDQPKLTRGNERSIVTSIFNRIGLDVAALNIVHCKVDEHDRFLSNMKSSLNDCLTLEANIDQTSRAFIHDIVVSMLDEGHVVIIPTLTSGNPFKTQSYDIYSMRTGRVVEWYPKHVKVRVYNEEKGVKQDVVVAKHMVAIVENPLYAVINEPNSTMQRLMRKLALLDIVDETTNNGKLDLIIQLPYSLKSPAKREQAEARRKDIEVQLQDRLGIAYTDATERIVQLNRPIENNLLKQIEYLTTLLYSQLGIAQSILDGTADEQTLLNYHTRTIEPVVSAIVDEMRRKFLTKTARSQNQTIKFFRDPFKLVPINNIAQIADTFTRNEILTSNEVRQIIGMKPSSDPKADELRNSNMPQEGGEVATPEVSQESGAIGDIPMAEVNNAQTNSGQPSSFGDIPISELLAQSNEGSA